MLLVEVVGLQSNMVLGCPLVWVLPGGARSATTYKLPGTTWHALQSEVQMAPNSAGFVGSLERARCDPRPCVASAGTWPLSERYGACRDQIQLV